MPTAETAATIRSYRMETASFMKSMKNRPGPWTFSIEVRRHADGPDAPWVLCASQRDAAVMVGVNYSVLSTHLNQSVRWRRTQLVPGVDPINGFVVRRRRDGVAAALRAASSGTDGDGVGATVRPHLHARGRVGAGGGDDRAIVEGEGGGGEGGGIKRRRDGDGGIGGTDGGNEPMSPAGAVAEVPAAPPAGRAPAKAKTPREATGQKKRVRPPRQMSAASRSTAAERMKEKRARAAAAVQAIEVVITDLLEKREERRRQHKRRQQLAAADGCAAVDGTADGMGGVGGDEDRHAHQDCFPFANNSDADLTDLPPLVIDLEKLSRACSIDDVNKMLRAAAQQVVPGLSWKVACETNAKEAKEDFSDEALYERAAQRNRDNSVAVRKRKKVYLHGLRKVVTMLTPAPQASV